MQDNYLATLDADQDKGETQHRTCLVSKEEESRQGTKQSNKKRIESTWQEGDKTDV